MSHYSFLQSTCFPKSHSLSSSPSRVTERMDLSTIPPRIEAKTKTQKNLLLWHFVPSHLNARQSQWTGVWGCVQITMVMALCLPRLPGGSWRVGGGGEGAVMEQVANQASTKTQSNEENGEEEMFRKASSMCNMATFTAQSELSPLPMQPLNSKYSRTEQLTPQQSKEADMLQGKPFTP